MTRATVIIPTHDHAATLPLAVRSALEQTLRDLEVVIVGDGATDEVGAAATDLERRDPRVRFLDLPKGDRHGEIHRDTAIRQAHGDDILYLCDDDLLLPTHVAELCDLLERFHFVQCRNGFVDAAGDVHLYPGDLGDVRFLPLLLDETRPFNFVSLTGTGHTKDFYLDGEPWTTTPPGVWPDLHQWRRMLRPGVARTATSPRMTALQFPTHGERTTWTAAERLAELETWAGFVRQPGAQQRVDDLAAEAARRELLDAVVREATRPAPSESPQPRRRFGRRRSD